MWGGLKRGRFLAFGPPVGGRIAILQASYGVFPGSEPAHKGPAGSVFSVFGVPNGVTMAQQHGLGAKKGV
jgi:hypothetical protein